MWVHGCSNEIGAYRLMPDMLQKWTRHMVFWHDWAHYEKDKQSGQVTDVKSAHTDEGTLCKHLAKLMLAMCSTICTYTCFVSHLSILLILQAGCLQSCGSKDVCRPID